MKKIYNDNLMFVNNKLRTKINNVVNCFNTVNKNEGFEMFSNISDFLIKIETLVDTDITVDVYVSVFQQTDAIFVDREITNKEYVKLNFSIKNTEEYQPVILDEYKTSYNTVINLNESIILDYSNVSEHFSKTEHKVNDILTYILSVIYDNNKIILPSINNRYIILKYS